VWRMLCAYRRASVFRDPEKLRDEHHAASEPSSEGDGTFDGRATTREVFEAYVAHFLAPPYPRRGGHGQPWSPQAPQGEGVDRW
jgi:hypothetical protein